MEVIFHRLASEEYLAALRWYARRSQSTAARFREAVGSAAQQIADAPNTAPLFDDAYRWIRLRRFPYLLYYRNLDDARILVVAVAHARRRPGYWRRRRSET